MSELSTNKQISSALSGKRLNKRERKYLAKKMIKRVRKDVGYLLKPKSWWMPFDFHVWLLSRLLYLDNKSLKRICLISDHTSEQKKT